MQRTRVIAMLFIVCISLWFGHGTLQAADLDSGQVAGREPPAKLAGR